MGTNPFPDPRNPGDNPDGFSAEGFRTARQATYQMFWNLIQADEELTDTGAFTANAVDNLVAEFSGTIDRETQAAFLHSPPLLSRPSSPPRRTVVKAEPWDAGREKRFRTLSELYTATTIKAAELEELRALNAARNALLADGACLTCLLQTGTAAFPVDPAYHQGRTGHAPVQYPE